MPLQSGSYNVLLISQQDVINSGEIDANLDANTVDAAIKIAQMQWTQEIIGTNLMVDLQNKIVIDSTLNTYPNEQFLMNAYLRDVLVWFTVYELSFSNSFKIKIKGLQKMSGENSTSATLSEIEAYQNRAKDRAEFFGQRLIRYLESNNLFPAFYQSTTFIGDMIPNYRSAYQSSLYIGSERGNSNFQRRFMGGDWEDFFNYRY